MAFKAIALDTYTMPSATGGTVDVTCDDVIPGGDAPIAAYLSSDGGVTLDESLGAAVVVGNTATVTVGAGVPDGVYAIILDGAGAAYSRYGPLVIGAATVVSPSISAGPTPDEVPGDVGGSVVFTGTFDPCVTYNFYGNHSGGLASLTHDNYPTFSNTAGTSLTFHFPALTDAGGLGHYPDCEAISVHSGSNVAGGPFDVQYTGSIAGDGVDSVEPLDYDTDGGVTTLHGTFALFTDYYLDLRVGVDPVTALGPVQSVDGTTLVFTIPPDLIPDTYVIQATYIIDGLTFDVPWTGDATDDDSSGYPDAQEIVIEAALTFSVEDGDPEDDPIKVPDDGGTLITATAAGFPTDEPVYAFFEGGDGDVACYSGIVGSGWECWASEAGVLVFTSPPMPLGTFTVRLEADGGYEGSLEVEVVHRSYPTRLYGLRSACGPPTPRAVGAFSVLDEE